MTKSDPRKFLPKLIKGAGLRTLDLFVGVALALAITPYMLDCIGLDHYAIWVLAVSFTGWYALLDFGLSMAVARFVTLHFARNEGDEINEIASTAFFIYLILGLFVFVIASAIAIGAGFIWTEMTDIHVLSQAIIISSCTFAISMPQRAFQGIAIGMMRQDLSDCLALVMRLLGGATTFTILYLGGGVTAILVGTLVVMTIRVIASYFLAKRTFPKFALAFSACRRSRAKTLLSFSVWTFIADIGNTIISRSDILIIMAMVSLSAVASYNLVVVMSIGYFITLYLALTSWQNNWFTHTHSTGNQALMNSSRLLFYKFVTYLTAFMAFGFIFWGQAFFTRWIGPEHLVAYPALVVIMIAAWISRGHASTNSRILFGIAKQHIYARYVIGQAVANIVISIAFVANGWGMLGVAFGTAISQILVQHILVVIYICRLFNESFFNYHIRLLRYHAIAGISLVLPAVVTYELVGPTYPKLILVGCLSAASYAVAIFFFGFTNQEKAKIKGQLFNRQGPKKTADVAAQTT